VAEINIMWEDETRRAHELEGGGPSRER
jgi:hypothetical protein